MKNEYEILSPFFLKLAGFCVSIFLFVLCLQLFVLNPRYIDPSSVSYRQINVYLIWTIIAGVFILCAFFSAFLFMKVDNSKIYLFNMYLLYCIMCVLFFFILQTRAWTVSNANVMLRIILCLGFIFIFLEFLHAQTSKNFIREKCILASIMGMAPCIAIFVISYKESLHGSFHGIYTMYTIIYMPYILYALHILLFSLLGKKEKTSVLFKCLFVIFLFLWVPSVTPNWLGGGGPPVINPLTLKISVIFCCTQLIPLREKLAYDIVGPLQGSMKNGMLMLVVRFAYIALLAIGMAYYWMRGWFF